MQNYITWIFFSAEATLFFPECELDREIQAFITDRLGYFPCTLNEPRFTLHLHRSHHRKTQANTSCGEIPIP